MIPAGNRQGVSLIYGIPAIMRLCSGIVILYGFLAKKNRTHGNFCGLYKSSNDSPTSIVGDNYLIF